MPKHPAGWLPLFATTLVALSGCPGSQQAADADGSGRSAPAARRESLLVLGPPQSESGQSERGAKRSKKQSQASAAGPAQRSKAAPNGPSKERTAADAIAADPVRRNGPIFEGWPKPKLALVLTGEQLGYIEPCGCAGLTNQKGGLRRRHTFLKQLEAKGWPTVSFDVGGLISRFSRQTVIKYQTTVDALRQMGYAAVAFGGEDLKLPAGEVFSAAINADNFVAANVKLLDFEITRFRVIEAGGFKIGVTAVVGESFQKEINNPEVQFAPAEKALAEVLPQLREAECDWLVLLSHSSVKESGQLASAFDDFDVVVTAGGADEPPNEAGRIDGSKSLFIQVGHKGMYAVTLGFYGKSQPVRYQRVPLDDRFKDSPEMDQLLVSYQDQLEQLGWEGLGLRPAEHPRGEFAGSESCRDCHDAEYSVWESTPHAHATETLIALEPPRQYDPECISCHSTGWHPQEYFAYASGFDSMQATPLMSGNGCENCHGPGAAHVEAENGGDERLQARLRSAMRLKLDAKTKETLIHGCMQCHDLDNSPDFDFDSYWPQVEH